MRWCVRDVAWAARVCWRARATLWREGGAPASPLDVISVRLGAPGLCVVEAPALSWFRGRPSGDLPTPVMGGASFPDVNHLFQLSYNSIACFYPQPQMNSRSEWMDRRSGVASQVWGVT